VTEARREERKFATKVLSTVTEKKNREITGLQTIIAHREEQHQKDKLAWFNKLKNAKSLATDQ